MRIEDIRDSNGKLTGVRIYEVDYLGRDTFADVPLNVAVGIDHSTIVSAVATELKSSVSAKSTAPDSASLTAAQVVSIARSKGSKR